MSMTLRELRKAVARRVKAYIELTSTASTAGLTFQDNHNLVDDASYYRGAEILFYTGVNAGEKRRVIGSNLSSGTLTLAGNALPGTTAIGDTAGLFNLRNRAFRVQELDAAINQSIADAHPHNSVVHEETLSGLFNKATPTLTIPADFTHVNRVEYYDPGQAMWLLISKANYEEGAGWYPEFGAGKLRINGDPRYLADGKQIRLNGRKRAPQLTLDSDATDTDTEWLLENTAAMLIMSQREMDQAAFGQYKQNRIDSLRVKMAWLPEADSVEVRP